MRHVLAKSIRFCLGWPLFAALLAALGFGVACFLGPEPRYSLPRWLMATDTDGRLFVQDDNENEQRGSVEIRDLATGRVLANYGSVDQRPYAILSDSGRRLVLMEDTQTRLIELATGRTTAVKERLRNHIFAVTFDATESWAMLDVMYEEWDGLGFALAEVATGAVRQRWRGDYDFLGFTKAGGQLVLRHGDRIEVIDPQKQKVTASLAKPGWHVMRHSDPKTFPPEATKRLWLETLPNNWANGKGKEALVGKAWDNGAWHITLHGLPKLDQLATIALAFKSETVSVQLSSDGRWLLVTPNGSITNGLEVWNVATGQKRGVLPPNFSDHFEVLAPDGSALAVTTKEGEVQLLELPALAPRWRRSYAGGTPFWVQFTPDSQTLVVAVDTLFPAEILDAATGKPRNVVETKLGFRTEEAWIRTGNRFVCSYGNDRRFGDKAFNVWENWLLNRFGLQHMTRHVHVVSDIATGEEVARLQVSSPSDIDLTADGRYLVTNDWHKPARVRVWDNPPARPWRWILGVPAGVGVLLLALRIWRKQRARAFAKQTG